MSMRDKPVLKHLTFFKTNSQNQHQVNENFAIDLSINAKTRKCHQAMLEIAIHLFQDDIQ